MVGLDDVCLTRVLHYINDPVARLCCRGWATHIHTALQLDFRIRFHNAIREREALPYHHSTVRDFGGLEECVSFNFRFLREGTYVLQWFREGLTTDNEQQYGTWHVVGEAVRCESLLPLQKAAAVELRYALPGRIFDVPVDAVLTGTTSADQQLFGWELAARGVFCSSRRSAASLVAPPETSESAPAPMLRYQAGFKSGGRPLRGRRRGAE